MPHRGVSDDYSSIDVIEEAGGVVSGILTVVDREEGGTEKVKERGDFRSLVKAKDLLDEADKRTRSG